MKKFLELKIGHGWFNGYARETDTISTIDSGMSKWHILLVELADDNEITQRERERVPIKNRTKTGYLMAYDGDSIDISKRMVYHRGTVQHGIAHTIKTEIDVGVLEFEHKSSRDAESSRQTRIRRKNS